MKKSVQLIFVSLLLLTPFTLLRGQEDVTKVLPQDSAVVTGTLENGLKYYIRQNNKPEQRIEFRLVVNAGSILEDDDQQGLAHFLEHMAFNGTKHFDKNDLVGFLEKSGVNFGADLNAYTGFDETVYMFQIPSDRQGLVDTAFMILEDWAHNLSLDTVEIDKERGVVHEEWRLGLGAQDRMMKKVFPIIFKGSRYAIRIPIGKMSVIDSCNYEVIDRFYYDWYRPDLMAVIVVGDIDPAYAETKIKEHFGTINNPEKERERKFYDIPGNKEPLVAVATDKEAFYSQVMLLYKQDKLKIETQNDYHRQLMINLYVRMLNSRLNEIVQKSDAPFAYAQALYMGYLSRSRDAFGAVAMAKTNKIPESIEALVKENERARKYGFQESELERQKAEILSNMEKAVKEKDKTESKRYVGEYVSNFLESEAFPGIEYEYELTKELLPEIHIDELNQLAGQLVSDSNLVVLVLAPEKEDVSVPDEEEILTVITQAANAQLEDYNDESVSSQIIEDPLPGAEITEKTTDERFGITTLKLSNGITVFLKPTDFKNDEILMKSFGLGGTSIVPDNQVITATYADEIINESGVGNMDKIMLQKFLTGKNVSVTPFIGDLDQGIKGSSVKKDLETMFQLTYLYFTHPRKDEEAFETFKAQTISRFKYIRSNPQAVFYDTIAKLATQNSPRTITFPTEEQINSINLDEAYTFYKELFANANGYTFTLVGSFDNDSIIPLITKYLGSLPATDEKLAWKDVSPEFPEGITEATVFKGTEPQSFASLMMNEPFEWSSEHLLKKMLLMKILKIRMRESMREDQGGVYGVRAYASTSKFPKEEINISISWGCAPENVDRLVQTVFFEMDTLKMTGPGTVNLEKAKATSLREYEINFKENNYWLSKINGAAYLNEEILTFDEIRDIIDQTDSEDLKKLASSFFNDKHYLKVILLPENLEK